MVCLVVIFPQLIGAVAKTSSNPIRNQIAMRSIGHELLKESGNDTSQLAVVQQNGSDYTIALGDDFHFIPDSLMKTVNRIMATSGISSKYFVQMYNCDSSELVYGYGFDARSRAAAMPCLGRFQPRDCYKLTISLNDVPADSVQASIPTENATPELESDQASSTASQLALVFVMVGLVMLYSWNNKKLKKAEEASSNHINIGKYQFDIRHLKLIHDNEVDELTSKEADLLLLLFQHINETVERSTILKEVWEDEGSYDGRTLDVYISKLRKKLESDPSIKIINVRGVGYKLAVSVRPVD